MSLPHHFVVAVAALALVAVGCGGGAQDTRDGAAAPNLSAIAPPDLRSTDLAMPSVTPPDLLPSPDLAGCEGSRFCPNPRACACQEPVNASACGAVPYSCLYQDCTFICVCRQPDQQWNCCTTDPPPTCPRMEPSDGDFCCLTDQRCPFACSAGQMKSCACQANHTWKCTVAACGG